METPEEFIEQMGWGKFQWRLLAIGSLLTVVDGMEASMLATIGPVLICEWGLKTAQLAFLSSSIFVGMAIGSLFLGKLADIYGRKKVIVFASIFVPYFGLMSAFSPVYAFFVIVRTCFGISLSCVYQSMNLMLEYSPRAHRARVMSFIGVMWSLGMFFGVLLGILILPRTNWRVLILVYNAPCLLSLIVHWWCPESLRYLVAANQKALTKAMVKNIASLNGNKMAPSTSFEQISFHERGSLKDLLLTYTRTTVFLSIKTAMEQAAYYGIVFLQPTMLQSDGNKERCLGNCTAFTFQEYLSMLWPTIPEVIGLIFVPKLLDKWGRMKTNSALNLIGGSLIAVFLCKQLSLKSISVLFGIIRGILQSSTFIFILLAAELYPTRLRGVACGAMSMANKVGTVFGPLLSQGLYVYNPSLTIGILSLLCVTSSICVLLLPKETKDEALTDFDSDRSSIH